MSGAVEWGAKYTLTGPDGTIAVFNDSTDPNYVGILSPESSGLDSPEVRETAADRTEDDGGIHGDFYYGRRPIVLQGTIIASSATQRNERVEKLKKASNAMRADATLKWKPAGASEEVQVSVRRQQPLRITKGYVKDFQVPLVSADARIESATEKSSTSAITTTKKFPSTVISTTGVGTVAWTNPGNAAADDGTNATVALPSAGSQSNWLKATNFGFSIPEGASVVGNVKLFLEAVRSAGTGVGKFKSARFVLANIIQGSGTGEFGTVESAPLLLEEILGAANTAQVLSSEFGVAVYAEATAASMTVASDSISLQVKYASPLTVENKGNAPADFIATLTPDAEATGTVLLENIVTGEHLLLESGAISGTTPIVIDTRSRTITRGGTSIYNLLNFSASDWFKLTPGANTLKFAKGALKVQWHNAWL